MTETHSIIEECTVKCTVKQFLPQRLI